MTDEALAVDHTVEPAGPLARVVPALSLKDKAYAAIKEAILSLKLQPGQSLVEEELAQQLGISKTPVREALHELEREGFVVRNRFRGVYVAEISFRDVREIFEIRAVLEGLAVRLAVPTLTPADLAHSRKLLEDAMQALETGDAELCSRLGKQFHDSIIRKADNGRLHATLNHLEDHLWRFRSLSDQVAGRLAKSQIEHRRILEALEQHDPYLAEQRMREHLHSVLQDLEDQ